MAEVSEQSGEIIATIPKNSAEQIRVTLSEFKGRQLLGMRVWWHAIASDEWHPSRKGFAVGVARLPELRVALEEAERQARKRGLLEPDVDEGA